MTRRYAPLVLGLLLCTSAGAQTLTASDARVGTALEHVASRALAGGALASDVADLSFTSAYADEQTGLAYVYVVQRLDGIQVPEGQVTVAIGRDGRIFHAAGSLMAGLGMAETRRPSLSAVDAASRAADYVGLGRAAFSVVDAAAGPDQLTILSDGGVAQEAVSAHLVYRRRSVDADNAREGALRLAWEVNLYQRDSQHSWVIAIDAVDGSELYRHDLVVHDEWGPGATMQDLARTEAALGPWMFRTSEIAVPVASDAGGLLIGAYRVYGMPVESPNHAAPLPPADGRTLIANPDVPGGSTSPFGWHDTNGAPGPEFTTTQGNNVHAYTDVDANNTPDAGSSPDGTGALLFDFPLDLTLAPSAYRPAAVANLFYWNNIMHDVWAVHGFSQASGNFQQTNYGGGGVAGDYVRAEAQDGLGFNNANFCTPPEGGSTGCGSVPRMQMFLWDSPNPDRDGDLDNGIIAHEYGHGISHRLVGGPAVECFGNADRPDEGLSDWYGVMLTMQASHNRTTNRGVGTYALNQPITGVGIRPAPYNTNFAVNGFTYQATRTQAVPHGVGFVWATILWEVTWDMIDAHGFEPNFYLASSTAGNVVMMRLTMQALKLVPCSPGFVDFRNAILAADAALYPDAGNPGNGLHYATLWTAFARRGLGFSASQGSTSNNADNTEAFDVPLPPAAASITPAAIGVSVATDGSTTRTVNLANTAAPGSQNLNYSVAIQNATIPVAPEPSGGITIVGAARVRGIDESAGTGPVQNLGSGGPDAFGYVWADSNEPGGPAVNFQDISATGTPVAAWTLTDVTLPGADEGYVDRTIPFPFPFYGSDRTSVRISTNGFLHFSSFAANSFTNGAVPSTTPPNSVIAPFWDDLDGSTAAGGTVHTGTVPDGRFVIQFTNWPRWNQAGSSTTFQVLLSANGTIEYQYATMTGTLNSASVGIENDGGTTGLSVAFNAAYVTSNKAVRFTPPPDWVSVSPNAGSVAPGANANVTVTFDADGLAAGLYEADLVVTTNDPAIPSRVIPVSMQTGGLTFADGAGWRMLAAPVSGMTVDNLASQNLVQGVPGYYPTAATNLYTAYNGTGWTPSTGTGQVLTSGTAAIWYLYDLNIVPGGPSNSVALPMTITSPVALNEPATDVSIGLHSAGNDWNLVGNPFVSSLDVSGIAGWATGGALASAVGQVWDPRISSYRLTTALGNILASWQGVMIQNSTATGLTIPRSARDDGGVFQGFTTEDRMVAFELESTDGTSGAPLFDRAIILYFHPDATAEWDLWDATKLTPLSPSYAVLSFEGMRDGDPVLKAQESRVLSPDAPFDVTLDLDAVGTGTSFTLRWPELVNIPDDWDFTIQDLVTGQTVDLRDVDSYTFTATPGAARSGNPDDAPVVDSHAGGSARFVLHVSPGVSTGNAPGALPTVFALGAPAPNPATGEAMLRYDVPQASDVAIEVFDLLGRRVTTLVDAHAEAGRHTARLNAGALASGVYVVRMRAGEFVEARRVTVVR